MKINTEHTPSPYNLPAGLTVFERGWLSSNNILIAGKEHTALIDSGYCTHAEQTLALLRTALGNRSLDLLVNTHLHSDHCGGNALLQSHFPRVQIHIPPGQAESVRTWDLDALTYAPTGQNCPRYIYHQTLCPGMNLQLGDLTWQVHASPGHDPHSVIFFEPSSKTLISADALWERGFGVIFPELDGNDAFEEASTTLDLIESLQPTIVIPGHGAPFTNVRTAMAYARERLNLFVQNPNKHMQYAAKVLLKFKLLESQSIKIEDLETWVQNTPYLSQILAKHLGEKDPIVLTRLLIDALIKSKVARLCESQLHNI